MIYTPESQTLHPYGSLEFGIKMTGTLPLLWVDPTNDTSDVLHFLRFTDLTWTIYHLRISIKTWKKGQ